MRNSIFLDKVFGDLSQFGISPKTELADKCIETLEFVADSMDIELQPEFKDTAYLCYAIGYNTLVGIFESPQDTPEYMASIPSFEGKYRGIEIILNDVRFRGGYLGETQLQEDFNTGLICMYMFMEYTSLPNIIPPNEETMFYLNLIRLGQSIAERVYEPEARVHIAAEGD